MREDERRAVEADIREARDSGYGLMSHEPTDPHFKCPTCGAIVEDWKLHRYWHEHSAGELQ